MQQFVVPQFIDVENKILGPFTSHQFVLLIVFGVLEFGAYKFLNTVFFAVVSIFLGIIFGSFAFLKPNGKPFHYFLLSAYKSKASPTIRVWHTRDFIVKLPEVKSSKEIREAKRQAAAVQFSEKKTKPSKLSELSLIVDTGGVYEGEETPEETEKAMESLQKPNRPNQ